MYSNVKSRLVLNKAPKNPIAFNDPWKKGVFFVQLWISGGFLVNTDKGQFNLNELDIEDTSWKELIATGEGDLQVLWDGSIKQDTKKETCQLRNLDSTLFDEREITTYSEVSIGVGKYGFGFATERTMSFDIKANPSYNDFNTIIQEGSIELLINVKDVEGIDFKKFRFYAFPEFDQRKVFYISSLTENRDVNDNTKIISYQITFTRVSNKLQKSGKAIEEFIHFSPIGGFFPWPIINRETKTIELDTLKMYSNGIVYMNEEYYNASIHNNTALIGWEIVEDEEDLWVGKMRTPTKNEDGTYTVKLYAPKVIHQMNFTAGESSILNRRALPESDISFLNFLNFSEDKYTSWKKYFEQMVSGEFDTKYAGECSYVDRRDFGSYEKLNEPFGGNSFAYKQNFVANPYVSSDFGIIPNAETLSWKDINMFNYWCNRDIITLPFSFNYHVINQPREWPVIGKIVDLVSGGFPFGTDEEHRKIVGKNSQGILEYNRDICGITSQSIVDIATKNWNWDKGDKPENNIFYLNDFYAKDSSDRFNVANRTLCIASQLSDGLSFDNTNFNVGQLDASKADTSWVGQTWINGGTQDGKRQLYYAKTNNDRFLLNKTFRLKTDKIKKYIICGISNKNFAAEAMRFEFKDENFNKQWAGSFMTNSNFRNTSRDWANDFYCNYFNILSFNGNSLEYPEYPTGDNQFDNVISIPFMNYISNVSGDKWYTHADGNGGVGYLSLWGIYEKPTFAAPQLPEKDRWSWVKNESGKWFSRWNISDYKNSMNYSIQITNFPDGTTNFLQAFIDRVKSKKIELKFDFGISSKMRGIDDISYETKAIIIGQTNDLEITEANIAVGTFRQDQKNVSIVSGSNYNWRLREEPQGFLYTNLVLGSNAFNNEIKIKLISFNQASKTANFNISFSYTPDVYFYQTPDAELPPPHDKRYSPIFFKETLWEGYYSPRRDNYRPISYHLILETLEFKK